MLKYGFSLLLLSAPVLAQVQSDSTPVTQFKDEIRATYSPVFKQMEIGERRSAAAIVNNTPISSSTGIADVVNSDTVKAIAKQQAQINANIEKGVGEDQVKEVKLNLPSISAMIQEVKSGGKMITVSNGGGVLVTQIQALPKLRGVQLNEALTKINAYSNAGYPEAQNYLGFIYEYGLYQNPKNQAKANFLYTAAAKKGYQPAVYNLALVNLYGKGVKPNIRTANDLADKAADIGKESSSRACGLASFINYRQQKSASALSYARDCRSALADLPEAALSPKGLLLDRINRLEASLSSGADDGFSELATLTKYAPQDEALLACKYAVLNTYRWRLLGGEVDIARAVQKCEMQPKAISHPMIAKNAKEKLISAFVMQKIQAYKRVRESNRFMYRWSVPYLPFQQMDVEAFRTLMPDEADKK